MVDHHPTRFLRKKSLHLQLLKQSLHPLHCPTSQEVWYNKQSLLLLLKLSLHMFQLFLSSSGQKRNLDLLNQ